MLTFKSAEVDTTAGDTLIKTLNTPVAILIVYWAIPTIWVKSGARTKPENWEVVPAW